MEVSKCEEDEEQIQVALDHLTKVHINSHTKCLNICDHSPYSRIVLTVAAAANTYVHVIVTYAILWSNVI